MSDYDKECLAEWHLCIVNRGRARPRIEPEPKWMTNTASAQVGGGRITSGYYNVDNMTVNSRLATLVPVDKKAINRGRGHDS